MKSHINILIYDIRYVTIKKRLIVYIKNYIANPLFLVFNKMNG